MNLEYLPATDADIPVIFTQAKELIDTYEDLASIDYDKVLAWMNRKIASNISEYRCVLLNGEKTAYYRLCKDGELDDLYVLPGFRGKGIGTEILKKCQEESADPLYLYVFSQNTRAIAFYRRFGLEITKTVGKTRLIMTANG